MAVKNYKCLNNASSKKMKDMDSYGDFLWMKTKFIFPKASVILWLMVNCTVTQYIPKMYQGWLGS